MLDVADRSAFEHWFESNEVLLLARVSEKIEEQQKFSEWFNGNKEDFFDQMSQRPRAIKLWAADLARVMRSATTQMADAKPVKRWAMDFATAMKEETDQMGADPGFAGVFSDGDDEMGLHDPEAMDEENW